MKPQRLIHSLDAPATLTGVHLTLYMEVTPYAVEEWPVCGKQRCVKRRDRQQLEMGLAIF